MSDVVQQGVESNYTCSYMYYLNLLSSLKLSVNMGHLATAYA